MKQTHLAILDANEATASVAYRLSEIIAIYPITPSSAMAEFCDEWHAKGQKNLWGIAPDIAQLQSEGGVAGALHGALQAGTLATTFTASQGLLLMLPNMFKIAGELTPFCMHVTARSVATHALSIFGDHSDVMVCRSTGFAFLVSSSVQEAHDMAAVAHAATLESRIPFVHFFDGFRTSHEINNCQLLSDDDLRALIEEQYITEMRQRALTPDHPSIRGTAQNPDVFFQAREAGNAFYARVPAILEKYFDKLAQRTGRHYRLFDYYGAPDADRVVIAMGSSTETLRQVAEECNRHGEKVGALKVRLFRPFSLEHLIKALPETVRSIAVLDRTKEPGALGEPLFLDVAAALQQAGRSIRIIGGRYGLGSKEFSPAMAKAVFDELQKPNPRNHFTIGIDDDVTNTSLAYDPSYQLPRKNIFEAMFFGLGSDGTVGANKNTVKIISNETDQYAQAYFVYDSKKSGAMTISHLRFGDEPIEAPYLIQNADFIGCHQFSFINRYDLLKHARDGAALLINAPYSPEDLWGHLVREVQEDITQKHLKVYTIDAYQVARQAGMGGRINTIMQTCFFAISGILPREEAIAKIKQAIQKTYAKKGEAVIQQNFEAVEQALAHLHLVPVQAVNSNLHRSEIVSPEAPAFVRDVIAPMMRQEGDTLPVSAMPIDGRWPSATSQWEKRDIAQEIPEWDPSICIQCNKCSSVCPHAAIRTKYYPESMLNGAPEGFASANYRTIAGQKFTVQVSPMDCTGCGLCHEVCPAKNRQDPTKKALNMVAKETIFKQAQQNYTFFQQLPTPEILEVKDVKTSQFRTPLFEFSGACAGCGETPYIKLLTQLFGDHLLIANATGCSSIYGGNLPTTPYTVNVEGCGPAWANSLFEDNAEFGFGIQLATEKKRLIASELLQRNATVIGMSLVDKIYKAKTIPEQRQAVRQLQQRLTEIDLTSEPILLRDLAENLIRKTTWVIGGDGWAYDIGYGGLDHVLASGRDINVLILDTEVYSNTGGQQSKSTPAGAIAKFAAEGKSLPKKDIGRLAISYGNIYVAQVALGANNNQTVRAMLEADAYRGPSLIVAYCSCIAHGFDLRRGLDQQKKAVQCGHWPLYRYDPKGKFQLDSKSPTLPLADYMAGETRFNALQRNHPERAQQLIAEETERIQDKFAFLEQMANGTKD
ncbi:MAG: pyruvate:ferredoxin (flavodoxin) oxidoreductase [Verrucomicrobiota bacterium]|nr:MAG: pyruvate:ferredoxin (flavodoxin) oxidoreductase [Verrucomicrobiota bacterium]